MRGGVSTGTSTSTLYCLYLYSLYHATCLRPAGRYYSIIITTAAAVAVAVAAAAAAAT